MSWGQPLALLALLLLPLVGWLLLWARRQRQQALAQLGDVALLTRGRNGRSAQSLRWLLALSCFIIALARPQWGQTHQSAPAQPLQIMFVLDASQSMLAADMVPDRFAQARQTILALLATLPTAEVGLVLFAGQSSLHLPLTADHQLFRSHLTRTHPSQLVPQGTDLAGAIQTAVVAFNPLQYSQKIIILLSDGEAHNQEAARAVQEAAANQITIYTIGFGSEDGAPIPAGEATGEPGSLKVDRQGNLVWSKLNQAALQRIATGGNGRYFPAATEDEQEAILTTLANAQESPNLESRPSERFQLFLLIGLIILFWERLR